VKELERLIKAKSSEGYGVYRPLTSVVDGRRPGEKPDADWDDDPESVK
jgi:capsule polysaccharide export protein KpsC/LpsZ